jgi:hypothetical protein
MSEFLFFDATRGELQQNQTPAGFATACLPYLLCLLDGRLLLAAAILKDWQPSQHKKGFSEKAICMLA